jgi:REP element-mobilizing transposase RayT
VDDEDRLRLLEVLGQAMERFDAQVLAYCLMGNHYHFVLHTRRSNLSLLTRHVNGVYTQAFNRRHEKVGHLFQGRFKAILVDRDTYLLAACRYVELNPVRARLVRRIDARRWSSYRAHAGMEAAPVWLDGDGLHRCLLGRQPSGATDHRRAARQYAELVDSGTEERLWDHALRQQIYLGDNAFVERMQARIGARQKTARDVPRAQRRKPLSLAQLLAQCASREEALYRAYTEGGQSMTSIAAEVGLSVSRVSRLIAAEEARSKA